MPMTIGGIVASLRRKQGLSQKGVERLTHGRIKAGWLASLETGHIERSSPEKLKLLAEILGTTYAEILRSAGIIEIPPEGMTAQEETLVCLYRNLSPEYQKVILRLARCLNQESDDATGVAARAQEG